MVNVWAQFPDGTLNQHNWPDGATVLDLKNSVSADGASPLAFQGQPAASLLVSTGGGGALADATGLIGGTTYDLNLVVVFPDGGQVDGGGGDGNDRDPYVDRGGYRAPPNSPRGGANDGTNGHTNGRGGGNAPDGYVVYVYVSNVAGGPREYSLEAGSTAAMLKERIAADSGSPLASVAAGEFAIYDGTNWLNDSDPVTGGAAYTVQRVR
jgi:hypothetical protein